VLIAEEIAHMNRTYSFVQPLEKRCLLSAELHGRNLFIRGEAEVNDAINVGLNAAGDKVQVTINGGEAQLFDAARVRRIIIRSLSGDDTITVDGSVNRPTWIDAGAGNDSISTGASHDRIHAGDGNDTIDAGDGRNWIATGTGNDNITTGKAADLVHAGSGDDTVNSGAGHDVVLGGDGNDQIDLGAGNDRGYGGRGDDVLAGGDGNDWLWGNLGDDNLIGGAGNDVLGGVLGANTLSGGEGKDRFVVRSSLDGQTHDFDESVDVLIKRPARGSET
jgi:Ca2+-binding RTX toxin-like protein